MYLLFGVATALEELSPGTESRLGSDGLTALLQDGDVKALFLHADGHLINGGHVFALAHAVEVDVTEGCHLLADIVIQMLLCAEHEDVGLDTYALELFHTVLCRFRLQLTGSAQIGHIGEVDINGTLAQLPFQLTDSLHVRSALDVADGTADLRDDKVVVVFLAEEFHVAFDLIGDMGHHLDRLAQIVTATLFVDHRLIDTTGGERVGLRSLDAGEALIVTQVEVGFHTIYCYIAFSVLIGIERTGVNVNIGVKFLDSDVVASGLKQFADRGRDNTFAEGRYNTARDEYILCFCHNN